MHDKRTAFAELLHKTGLAAEDCAYIGDDVIEEAVLQRSLTAPGVTARELEQLVHQPRHHFKFLLRAPQGIAVTAICPDAVQTPMLDIQKGKEQAALTFSGLRALGTDEVVEAIVAALDERPLEVMLPAWRGATAKFANAFPVAGARAVSLFQRLGRRRQQALEDGRDPTRR